jgi:hypothetical protein
MLTLDKPNRKRTIEPGFSPKPIRQRTRVAVMAEEESPSVSPSRDFTPNPITTLQSRLKKRSRKNSR